MTSKPSGTLFKYIPGPSIVELISLKSYRDEGHFYEDMNNQILKDYVQFVQPRKL